MRKKFDCIIIGTGCGGSAAAALSAHNGKKTLVLEKNSIVGGRCATHEIKGFKMDHGHLFARGPKGPHGELLRIVGCKDLIPSFIRGTNLPQKVRILDKEFLMQGHAKTRVEANLKLLNHFRQFNFSIREWVQMVRLFMAVAVPNEKKTRELDDVSINDWLAKYTSNKYLKAILGAMGAVSFGALPYEASAGEMIRSWRTSLKEASMGYPINGEGAAAIPKSFLRAAQRLGAEIRLETPVERIVVKKGRATGVIIDGKMIPAGMVISNIGLRETTLHLVGKKHFEKNFLDYIKGLKYSYGGISLKYALDKPVIKWDHGGIIPENFDQNMTDAFEGRIPEDLSIMLVVTSNIDPELAPPGKQTLLAISPGPVAEPGTIKWKPWVENFKRQVENFVPEIKGHIMFCIASTPDVIARENSRTFGDAVGVAQTLDQVGKNAPSPVSPINGLYYVGADVGSTGVATEMATQSAIDLFKYFDGECK